MYAGYLYWTFFPVFLNSFPKLVSIEKIKKKQHRNNITTAERPTNSLFWIIYKYCPNDATINSTRFHFLHLFSRFSTPTIHRDDSFSNESEIIKELIYAWIFWREAKFFFKILFSNSNVFWHRIITFTKNSNSNFQKIYSECLTWNCP